jgi:hypothetical protein
VRKKKKKRCCQLIDIDGVESTIYIYMPSRNDNDKNKK